MKTSDIAVPLIAALLADQEGDRAKRDNWLRKLRAVIDRALKEPKRPAYGVTAYHERRR